MPCETQARTFNQHGRSRALSLLSIFAVLATLITISLSEEDASAAVGGDFDPAMIITDELFFDRNAMSESQIQAFLESKVSTCSNANCLRTVRTDTSSRVADAVCSSYAGASQESTARIIYKVQQACGVSAKVLLVTLEKEQSLVSARGPSASTLDRAMGYACPDNTDKPGWCDPAYAGLYNQIYRSAWQFKRYTNPPGTDNFFSWFPVGRSSNVLYNPNAACGSSPITIRNAATAALYYYTPYQPNAAALANLYGTGDGCSAYGNRNFWRLYTDWFGSTKATSNSGAMVPIGNYEAISASPGIASVRGWALDPDTRQPILIHVYVDGVLLIPAAANVPRADVGAAYPDLGSNHGFSLDISLRAGAHSLCIYAINDTQGDNPFLGCKSVTVPGGPPIGSLDSVQLDGAYARILGWTVDPDSPTFISLKVTINGKAAGEYPANTSRADVASAYPAYGPMNGFDVKTLAPVGTSRYCITAVNVGGGADTELGCRDLRRGSGSPLGNFESARALGDSVEVIGWAIDPDVADPVRLTATVDVTPVATVTANTVRPDVGTAYPGYGDAHGFSARFSVPPGRHAICLTAVNVGDGANASLGCRVLDMDAGSPMGSLDAASQAGATARFSGWAFDPDTNDAVVIRATVNGTLAATSSAALRRPDVASAHPAAGANRGFEMSVPLPGGRSQVCLMAGNIGSGHDLDLGCRTFQRAGRTPFGRLDQLTQSGGSTTITGWAIDPDVVGASLVRVKLDGTVYGDYAADAARADVGSAFPEYGPNHGFTLRLAFPSGTRTICLEVPNTGDGVDLSLGCRTVTVSDNPTGNAEQLTAVNGRITARGWALDPNSPQALAVKVRVDVTDVATINANASRPDVAQAFPGSGAAHGFAWQGDVGPGPHRICLIASNIGPGADATLSCIMTI